MGVLARGAAVNLAEKTAVVADVHLGYEWARGSTGDVVPPHSLNETIAKLTSLLARAEIARLVVAGDLVESARSCPRTARDVLRLSAWLRRGRRTDLGARQSRPVAGPANVGRD